VQSETRRSRSRIRLSAGRIWLRSLDRVGEVERSRLGLSDRFDSASNEELIDNGCRLWHMIAMTSDLNVLNCVV
jgi:hypothetical protein